MWPSVCVTGAAVAAVHDTTRLLHSKSPYQFSWTRFPGPCPWNLVGRVFVNGLTKSQPTNPRHRSQEIEIPPWIPLRSNRRGFPETAPLRPQAPEGDGVLHSVRLIVPHGMGGDPKRTAAVGSPFPIGRGKVTPEVWVEPGTPSYSCFAYEIPQTMNSRYLSKPEKKGGVLYLVAKIAPRQGGYLFVGVGTSKQFSSEDKNENTWSRNLPLSDREFDNGQSLEDLSLNAPAYPLVPSPLPREPRGKALFYLSLVIRYFFVFHFFHP